MIARRSRFGVFFLLWFVALSAQAAPARVKVLTLNAWLLRVPIKGDIAKDIAARIILIPSMVKEAGADIICMQEVWGKEFREKMVKGFKDAGYEYSAFGGQDGPVFGNGLLIVSRLKLVEKSVAALAFSRHTRGDEIFVKKGGIKVQIMIADKGVIDVYTTHLGATTYIAADGHFNADEVKARGVQQGELLAWMQKTREKDNPLILTGDFNNHWQVIRNGKYEKTLSPEYEKITDRKMGAGLIDTYREAKGADAAPGFTTDVTGNPYSDNPNDPALKTQPSVVDDYIFISPMRTVRVKSSEVVFKDEIPKGYVEKYMLPSLPKRLSDHYGVMTELELD